MISCQNILAMENLALSIITFEHSLNVISFLGKCWQIVDESMLVRPQIRSDTRVELIK